MANVSGRSYCRPRFGRDGLERGDKFKKDEVFKVTHVIQVPGAPHSFRLTSAGTIRCSTCTFWLTATTSRSTS